MLANLNEQPLAEVETLLQSTRNRSKRKDDLGALKLVEADTIEHLFEYVSHKPPPGAMNQSLSIIANLLTNADGKERLTEPNVKLLVRILDEMAADEIYDEIESETANSIISRIIRALANGISSSETNRTMIQSVPGIFKSINSCAYNNSDEELVQMSCRLIRLLSSTTDYRKQASKWCGELVAKALIMERATAKAAIRTVSTLSKAATIELASALTHHDAKPLKIIIRAITSRDVQVRRDALSALVRLTQEQGACRPAIGNYGGLKIFVANLRSCQGHTKDGLPFLKCIDACTREAINRTRIRELGVFDIWADLLKKERSDANDPEHLLLKAQNIILCSLTNFYYDDESLQLMVDKNIVQSIAVLLKDTLHCDTDGSADYHPAAFTCDLPTVHNTTTRLAPQSAPETSLQLMKRLSPPQSPNRPDSPSSMGMWSPPQSPTHQRTFKRRRCSPMRTDSEDAMSDMSDVDTSAYPLNTIQPTQQHTQVSPQSNTSETAVLVMLRRFITINVIDIQRQAMRQICSARSIEGLFEYFSSGANLSWAFAKIVDRIIETQGHFNELITASFPCLVASSLKKRNQLIPVALDETELELAPVMAKWLDLFRFQAQQNAIYFELFIHSESTSQQLAAARCIPFLVKNNFRQLLPAALDILVNDTSSDNKDKDLTRAAWRPFQKLVAELPDVGVDLKNVGECVFTVDGDSESTVRVNEFTVDKSKLCAASAVIDTMLSSGFRESSQNQITIDHVQPESLRYFLHFITGCNSCTDLTDLNVLFEIDDLLQSYMIDVHKERWFILHIRHFWPVVKGEFLKSPGDILEKVTRDLTGGMDHCLHWPLNLCRTAFEDGLVDEIMNDFPGHIKTLLLAVI